MSDIQSQYPWAVNKSKLERAITEVRNRGQKETDENVKTAYKRLLGKIAGEDSSTQVLLEDLSLADLKKIAKLKGLKSTGSRDELIKSIKKVQVVNDDIDSDDGADEEDLTEGGKGKDEDEDEDDE